MNRRKNEMANILSIIPYEFYPARYGAALRCFHLLQEMAKSHEVWLLTVQPEADFHSDASVPFPENIRIVSTANQKVYRSVFNILPSRVANALNSRLLKRTMFERGNLYLLKTFPALKQVLQQHRIDLVIYENLQCFTLLNKQVRRLSKHTFHVYDAHNVDSELWHQKYIHKRLPALKEYSESALSVEKKLHKDVDLCFACSMIDKEKLNDLNDRKLRVTVIPNGVDTEQRPFDDNPNKQAIKNILFCGALDYLPNIIGLHWFSEQVFPIIKRTVPDITFTIIGKMNDPELSAGLKNDPAIHFIGPVESVLSYYLESSVFVVPLHSGSGTRLKILEAMSMGSAVVSTRIGAEGLDVPAQELISLADEPDEFAKCVIELLEKKGKFETQRRKARMHVVSKYDWKVIGEELNREISKVVKPIN